jgi:hypothetical protein
MDLRFKKAKLAFFIVPTKACQQIGASAKKALAFLIQNSWYLNWPLAIRPLH